MSDLPTCDLAVPPFRLPRFLKHSVLPTLTLEDGVHQFWYSRWLLTDDTSRLVPTVPRQLGEMIVENIAVRIAPYHPPALPYSLFCPIGKREIVCYSSATLQTSFSPLGA